MPSALTMNEDPAPNEPIRPWYRHRWPWLLAIAPSCALIGGMFTLWLAATTSDPLVVDDYYREGRAINQQLARDRIASSLGLRAQLRFLPARTGASPHQGSTPDGAPAAVELQLTAQRGSAWPQRLALRVAHATRAELDRQYTLEHAGAGTYRATGAFPAAGRWLVQLEDEARTWRLVTHGVRQFEEPIELQAATP